MCGGLSVEGRQVAYMEVSSMAVQLPDLYDRSDKPVVWTIRFYRRLFVRLPLSL